MSFLSIIGAAVLSTADLCEAPFEGGVGEPSFCVLTETQRVETPYFAITVTSGLLVGLDSEGRRIQIQGSLWQSHIGMTLLAIEPAHQAQATEYLGNLCAGHTPSAEAPIVCDQSNREIISRIYAYRNGGNLVIVTLELSSLAIEYLSQFDGMVKSIVIHGT